MTPWPPYRGLQRHLRPDHAWPRGCDPACGRGLFDELIVAVAVAHHKKTLFTLEQRPRDGGPGLAGLPQLRVLPFEGLMMDFCREQGACAVVRGIRNVTDFDYEAQMAAMNRKLAPGVEICLPAAAGRAAVHIEHAGARIAKLGGDVTRW